MNRSKQLLVNAATDLSALRDVLGDCILCHLCNERTHIVYGEGNLDADVLFVGEAPGRQEDETGRPFKGPAGGLLTAIITEELKLSRENVYITNVVKCRPPGNRPPTYDEVATCKPFMIRQIELVMPRVIVALGDTAAQSLLSSHESISSLRGKWRDYRGIPLMPTFHPSYIFYCPTSEDLIREDIKSVLQKMEECK